MRAIVDEFVAKGHVRVDLKVSDLIPEVVSGFQDLLEQDPEYLEGWRCTKWNPERKKRVPKLPWDDDLDDLLIERDYEDGEPDKDGRPHDNKVIFHYRAWSKALLYAMGTDFHRHEAWLNACHELHTRILRHWTHVCVELDRVFPGCDFVGDVSTTPFHVLRVMQYLETRPGTELIGKPHIDKSAATYHVAEQHEACELEGELLRFVPDRPVLFAAKGIQKATGGRILGKNHEAVVRPGFPERRWVVIFFPRLNLHNRVLLNTPYSQAAK